MRKIYAIVFAAILGCITVFAIPARRGFIKFTQPDGSIIMLQRHGDEFSNWVTDASGRVMQRGVDGYWRVAPDPSVVTANRFAARARRYEARRERSARAASHVAVGQKHFLVILVEFSDLSFESSTANQDFTNMLNQSGYNVNGGTGSARDFYYDNSHGYFEPIFDVYGPVKLTKTQAYYGGNDSQGNDKQPEEAVYDGCKALDDQIDFSQYDNDGDGYVDLVFMYYAGYGEADSSDEDSIWPHQWNLYSAGLSLTLDGKSIDSYACSNEVNGSSGKMNGIGTACHEFGHAMGLPDMYDTDYSTNGLSAAMFDFSTMDSGSYNNDGRTPSYFTVEERIILGWLSTDTIKEFSASGPVSLPSVNENVVYKTPTDMDGEYFVYEARVPEGWDTHLSSFGLIVTHIDKSSRGVKIADQTVSAAKLWSEWQYTNSINENGKHPCCYVVPAADQSNLMFGFKYYSEYQQYYYDTSYDPKIPFPGSSKVTSYVPVSWNGVESDITISDISYVNGAVSFNVTVPTGELDYNVIANPGNGVYTAGEAFALNLETSSAAAPAASVAWYYDDEPVSGTSVVLKAGTHLVEAVLTLDSGAVQTISLEIEAK